MAYYKKIIGEKCYLSPVSLDDIPVYTEWMNDLKVSLSLDDAHQNASLMRQEEAIKDMLSNGNQIYCIIDKQSDTIIGSCGLNHIDLINSRAELVILIGDKNKWGRGFGQEATRLILDLGFNILNLNSISLCTVDFNKWAIRAYENVGFKHAGKHREGMIVAGKKYDVIIMDILAGEFESPYVKKMMDQY